MWCLESGEKWPDSPNLLRLEQLLWLVDELSEERERHRIKDDPGFGARGTDG